MSTEVSRLTLVFSSDTVKLSICILFFILFHIKTELELQKREHKKHNIFYYNLKVFLRFHPLNVRL